MQQREGRHVIQHSVGTCLLVLLTLIGSVVTSQMQQTFFSKINNKRLDVTAKNVTTGSAIQCYVTCQQTSGCVSVNLSPDRRTCQLLSEETSNVTSLQSAEGWSYLRTYCAFKHCSLLVARLFMRNSIWVAFAVVAYLDISLEQSKHAPFLF